MTLAPFDYSILCFVNSHIRIRPNDTKEYKWNFWFFFFGVFVIIKCHKMCDVVRRMDSIEKYKLAWLVWLNGTEKNWASSIEFIILKNIFGLDAFTNCKVANVDWESRRKREEHGAASLLCHKNGLKMLSSSVGYTKCNFYYPIM